MKELVRAVIIGALLTLGASALGQTPPDSAPTVTSEADACRTAGVSTLRQARDTGFADLEATSAPVADAVRCLTSLGVITGPEAGAEDVAYGAHVPATAEWLNERYAKMASVARIGTEATVASATRGDFALAVDNLLSTKTDDKKPVVYVGTTGWADVVLTVRNPHPLTDINTANPMQHSAILRFYEAGITLGYGDGTFKPGKTITRGEAALIMRRALDFADIRPVGISIYMERENTDSGNNERVLFDDADSLEMEASVFGDGYAPVEDARVDVIVIAPGKEPCQDAPSGGVCEIDGGDFITDSFGAAEITLDAADLEDGSVVRVWTGQVGDEFSDATEYAEAVISLRPAAAFLAVEAKFRRDGARKAKFGETASVALTVVDADGEAVEYSGLPDSVISNISLTCREEWLYAGGGSRSDNIRFCGLSLTDGTASAILDSVQAKPAEFEGDRTSTTREVTITVAGVAPSAAGGEDLQPTPEAAGTPATRTFPADGRTYMGAASNSAVVKLEWRDSSPGLRLELSAPRWTECGERGDVDYPWACAFADDEGDDGAYGSVRSAAIDDFGKRATAANFSVRSLNRPDVTSARIGNFSFTRDDARGLVEYFLAEAENGDCLDTAAECEETDDATAFLEFYWAKKIERDDNRAAVAGKIAFRGQTNVVFSKAGEKMERPFRGGCLDTAADCEETDDDPDMPSYWAADGAEAEGDDPEALRERVAYLADFTGKSHYNIGRNPATMAEWEKALTEKVGGDYKYKWICVDPAGAFLKFYLTETEDQLPCPAAMDSN